MAGRSVDPNLGTRPASCRAHPAWHEEDITMNFEALEKYKPQALAILRIVTALAFMAHGTQKMFGFPPSPMGSFELFSLMGLAAVLEVLGGFAILAGAFTRPVALVLAGEMAYAFWFVHVPMGGTIIPVANGGDGAVLFCFVFLYLVFAGAGAWSVDGMRARAPATA
jgi:putative oxidoreductase